MNHMKKELPVRGFLMHLSHYDPLWTSEDWRRKYPFDLKLGMDLIDEMSRSGLNTLIVDCEDAIRFKSHPEIARSYTEPTGLLEKIFKHAAARNIEIIPKLNFSQSSFYGHNEWMYPHNKWDDKKDIFDSEEYWKIAFELIDDILEIGQTKKFHIGMDEDNDRSHRLFKDAINILCAGLAKRNIRTIMWRDSRTDPRGEGFTEKHNYAESRIPKDIIPIIWKYDEAGNPATIKHIIENGFELWGATGETASKDVVSRWRKSLLKYGGRGLILTKWIPCHEINRKSLMDIIKQLGPLL